MSDKALGKRRDRSPSRNREHRGHSNPHPDQHRSSNRTEDNQPQRQRGHSPRRGSPTRRLAPTLTYQHPWGYRHRRGRQLDEERERGTRLSRAMQDRDQKQVPVVGVSEDQVRRLQEENAALRHNLALASQQVREDNQRILNLHGRLEEAICFMLSNGHSVSATSGNSGTRPLPRPFFTITPSVSQPGRYIVPLPKDEDEKTRDVAYIPSSEGHLVQLYRDPYERVEYEDDDEDDGSNDSDTSDSTSTRNPTPAVQTGNRLRARSQSPVTIVIPPAAPVPSPSTTGSHVRAQPPSGNPPRETRTSYNRNVASATNSSQWNSDSWADTSAHTEWANEPPRWSDVVQRRPPASRGGEGC